MRHTTWLGIVMVTALATAAPAGAAQPSGWQCGASAVSTSLLSVMCSAAYPAWKIGRRELLETLAYDPISPSSITGALGAARENARRARETVSRSSSLQPHDPVPLSSA